MHGFKSYFNESDLQTESFYPEDIDQKIIQLYTIGTKIKDIETKTGKYRGYIYEILQREGILPSRLNQTRELVIQLHQSGVSSRKIAEIVAQSERNVRGIVTKFKNRFFYENTTK